MDIHEFREKAFNFVKINGPILPVQISKFLGSDILIASAILSDLSSQKKILITSVKYGGSPFYYAPGQEFKLVNLSENLKGKQKQIYDIIRQKKVLRDKFLEPWQRIAIREIKDFAKMLRVLYKENEEFFWKWYSLRDDEAKEIIKTFFVKEEPVEEIPEKKEEELPKESTLPTVQKKLKEEIPEKPSVKTAEPKKKIIKPDGEFYKKIINYFSNKNIKVNKEEIIRKNKEFDFITEIPSPVGYMCFYVKAKDKKKINDADLSLAYGEGRSQNMNVLFVSCGDMTKKAKTLIDKKFKGSLLFKKLK